MILRGGQVMESALGSMQQYAAPNNPPAVPEIFERLESVTKVMERLVDRANELEARLFGDKPADSICGPVDFNPAIVGQAHTNISNLDVCHQKLNSFLAKIEALLPSTLGKISK